jgi:hypothetical protein
MDKVAYYQSQLDKELAQYPLAKKVEEQTGIPVRSSTFEKASLIRVLNLESLCFPWCRIFDLAFDFLQHWSR